MAPSIGKRKREDVATLPFKKAAVNGTKKHASKAKAISLAPPATNGTTIQDDIYVQIVTGSYERVLHGIAAKIPRSKLQRKASSTNGAEPEASTTEFPDHVTFSDTFLMLAHESAIRCLAVSPPADEADKRYLATGDSNQKVNVYSLSTAPPSNTHGSKPSSLSSATISSNRRNQNLGTLNIHDRAITRLGFPSKAKLFSAAEDATVAITKTRDWMTLSTIKAPIPKLQGRPSGDTAAPGEIPAGINDFAIHPSQRIMLSVGRGEKCIRLWNLMTGKKAGVLNFDRGLLAQVGEGRFSTGEGRRVLWEQLPDPDVESDLHFVVGFEKGAALYGIDSKPKAVIKAPDRLTKFHEMKFLTLPSSLASVLAVSTEDGRILFFNVGVMIDGNDGKLPVVPCTAQLGGTDASIIGRIKDFDVLDLPDEAAGKHSWLFVTGSSDGSVRLWTVFEDEIASGLSAADALPKQVGNPIAAQKSDARITCLSAFVLDGKVTDAANEATEALAGADLDGGSEQDSEDSNDE